MAHLQACLTILYKLLDKTNDKRPATLQKFILENKLGTIYETKLRRLQNKFKPYKDLRDKFYSHIDKANLDYDSFYLIGRNNFKKIKSIVENLQNLIFDIHQKVSQINPKNRLRTLGPVSRQIRKLFQRK